MLIVRRRVKEQEDKSRVREERQRERLERLEKMVYAQHEKLDRVEDLVYRVMHRDRVNSNNPEPRSPPRRSETEATLSNSYTEEAAEDSTCSQTMHKENASMNVYSITNI
jgi:hypothetical protein